MRARVATGGKRFDSADHVRNYLFRVLRNLAIDRERIRQRAAEPLTLGSPRLAHGLLGLTRAL